jgi:hypothetical protein
MRALVVVKDFVAWTVPSDDLLEKAILSMRTYDCLVRSLIWYSLSSCTRTNILHLSYSSHFAGNQDGVRWNQEGPGAFGSHCLPQVHYLGLSNESKVSKPAVWESLEHRLPG